MTGPRIRAARADSTLEATLSRVEGHLASLGTALCDRNLEAIGHHGQGLHAALTQAVDRFSLAAKQGSVPEALRRRLAHASATVAAQRESLARATAALDRAIDVLMPAPLPASVYGTGGHSERSATSGCLHA